MRQGKMLAASPETTLLSNSSSLACRPFSAWDEGLEPKAVWPLLEADRVDHFLRDDLPTGCTVHSF